MAKGWIQLHRKLIDSPVFKNYKTLQVFMYCLLRATHEDYEAAVGEQFVKLKPGQLVTGSMAISAATNLSRQNTRTALKKLEKMQIITINPTTKYSVISITKWSEYQQTNQQLTNSQPTTNQQLTTNNNINNNNNSNNKDMFPKAAGAALCPHDKIIDLYHEILPELPQVKKGLWSGSKRETNLRARWRQSETHQRLEFWERFFKAIKRDDWYMGRTGDWKADLGWFLQRTNFEKAIEKLSNAGRQQ